MKLALFSVAAICSAPLLAQELPWQFDAPMDLSGPPRDKIFYHLESGTRRHLAVQDGHVGISWEDNRTGSPQVWFTAVDAKSRRVAPPRKISTGKAAYEPVIAANGEEGFVIAYEQDGGVWLSAIRGGRDAVSIKISDHGGQVALAAMGERVYVAYSRREKRQRRIYLAVLSLDNGAWRLVHSQCVDPDPPAADQIYPAVVATPRGVSVVWEDRRFGHTVLMRTFSATGLEFPGPTRLNRESRRAGGPYGKGTGVARVSLASNGEVVQAAWLDKRDFLTGHDVFAAMSVDGGQTFEPDERVQDEFGNQIAQWHAVSAVQSKGQAAIAWDDDRDGNADVWIAWRTDRGWSVNVAIPPASGAGDQTHPAVALDATGALHVVWLDRLANESGNRLWYAVGRPSGTTKLDISR